MNDAQTLRTLANAWDRRMAARQPAMKPTHTVPNSIGIWTMEHAGHKPVRAAVVCRDKQILACYPANLTNGRIPTMSEVIADARWQFAVDPAPVKYESRNIGNYIRY